ncbi:hypothetical protein J1614_008055 [Plenodomus biglobosus]|nr:hypothetical protein J1614_008055 [Plenodomus biglobosus]
MAMKRSQDHDKFFDPEILTQDEWSWEINSQLFLIVLDVSLWRVDEMKYLISTVSVASTPDSSQRAPASSSVAEMKASRRSYPNMKATMTIHFRLLIGSCKTHNKIWPMQVRWKQSTLGSELTLFLFAPRHNNGSQPTS